MEETAASLKDTGAQLASMLRVQGEKGWKAWSGLHGKLAEVAAAAAGDDPRTAVEPLLKEAEDASCLVDPAGNPDAQDSMRILEKKVRDVSKANPGLLKDLVLVVADELNMVPLGDSEPVQMVDEDSNFCEGNADRIIKSSAELSALNAPYAVVSIVGAQSSGKSFLLNRLFGTRFPEMDAKGRRCQTTRGIMMTRCIGPSLILLDIEGFDGREKGQDTLFEKQAALFALTVSDLMMVNMSIRDIGREQGGATPLFRTIFQERAKLSLGITKILVVLRFYDGETPLEILRSDVLESLEKIWESVNMESVKFKDYIEVNVVALPEKFSAEFPKEVAALRKLLSNNRSAKIPASSFSVSSKMLWDTIKENKKLDIPSHQVAVARLYCRQLVDNTLTSLDSQEDYKLLCDEESPRRFKEISDALMSKITTAYDLETKMYDPDVRDNERQYLVEKLHKIVTNVSNDLIWRRKEYTSKRFKREFDDQNMIQSMSEADADLYGGNKADACVQKFIRSFEDLKVFDSDYLHSICGDLEEHLLLYTAFHIQAIQEERATKLREKTKKRMIQASVIAIKLVAFAATGGVLGFGQ